LLFKQFDLTLIQPDRFTKESLCFTSMILTILLFLEAGIVGRDASGAALIGGRVSEFQIASGLISVLELATEAGTQSGSKNRVKQIQQDEKNEALDDNYPHRNHATNAEYRTPDKQIGGVSVADRRSRRHAELLGLRFSYNSTKSYASEESACGPPNSG
jgi:hypothetical protein